jgi:hypothetical protein
MSFLLLLMSTLQQNWRKGQKGSAWKRGGLGEEMAQTMYAHMNKWIKKK